VTPVCEVQLQRFDALRQNLVVGAQQLPFDVEYRVRCFQLRTALPQRVLCVAKPLHRAGAALNLRRGDQVLYLFSKSHFPVLNAYSSCDAFAINDDGTS